MSPKNTDKFMGFYMEVLKALYYSTRFLIPEAVFYIAYMVNALQTKTNQNSSSSMSLFGSPAEENTCTVALASSRSIRSTSF